MIRNLVSNAIKFTPPHGRVTCRLSREAEYIVFEVSDTGCGLSEENIQKLFKNVVQFHAKATQDGGGSGLGLWISKKIMDLHEGGISVTSEGEGMGSTFRIRLPIIASVESIDFQINHENAHRRPSIFGYMVKSFKKAGSIVPSAQHCDDYYRFPESLRILVVDDSPMNRKMLSRCFLREGYVVAEAEDGDTAVKILGDDVNAFDVVSLDNFMPRMNGPEAAQQMRSLGFRGKIIGVTGNALSEDIDVFLSHGADVVLPKPIDIDDFKLKVFGKQMQRGSMMDEPKT